MDKSVLDEILNRTPLSDLEDLGVPRLTLAYLGNAGFLWVGPLLNEETQETILEVFGMSKDSLPLVVDAMTKLVTRIERDWHVDNKLRHKREMDRCTSDVHRCK